MAAPQDYEQLRHAILEEELRATLQEASPRELLADAGIEAEELVRRGRREAASILEAAGASETTLVQALAAEKRLADGGWATRLLDRRRPGFARRMAALAGVGAIAVGLASIVPEGLDRGFGSWFSILGFVVALVSIVWIVPLLVLELRLDEGEVELAAERRKAAERSYRRELRQAAIRPWFRERINLERGRSYGTVLSYDDCSGLAELDDPSHEIPTAVKRRLLRLMEERMPGGAIGLAGPRGVGKSTLMNAICVSGKDETGERETLGVVVDAPVEYDAREFVLHLFARICSEVLGTEAVMRLRGWDRPFDGPLQRRGALLAYLRLAVGPTLMVAGAGLALSLALPISSSQAWGFALILVGYLWTAFSLGRELPVLRRLREARGARAGSAADEDDVVTASTRLRQIWFQQSFSTGWSGAFKSPLGLEAGATATTELAEMQMSLPDVVDLLREFLGQISSSRQVRIGIDELDKMDDETAQRFLNEIKVIFRIPGCFFLVSVSEDAMSLFERRGLPFRDVFDSSFDDVIQVSQLEFEGSRELLDRRIIGLPLPFACLLHCLSGGLPRDLIRSARDLVDQESGTDLEEATAALVGDALRSKAAAAEVAARRFAAEAHVTVLAVWLEELRRAGCDPDALLALCREFDRRFLAGLRVLRDEADLRAERREVQRLGTQLVAFAYLAATTLQLLARFDDSDFVDRAVAAPSAGQGRSIVDRLASVSQTFSADFNTAWSALSELRDDLDLVPLSFPLTRANGALRQESRSTANGARARAAR